MYVCVHACRYAGMYVCMHAHFHFLLLTMYYSLTLIYLRILIIEMYPPINNLSSEKVDIKSVTKTFHFFNSLYLVLCVSVTMILQAKNALSCSTIENVSRSMQPCLIIYCSFQTANKEHFHRTHCLLIP